MEAANHEVLHIGPLEIRPAEFVALAGGEPLPLTPHELELLTALASPEPSHVFHTRATGG